MSGFVLGNFYWFLLCFYIRDARIRSALRRSLNVDGVFAFMFLKFVRTFTIHSTALDFETKKYARLTSRHREKIILPIAVVVSKFTYCRCFLDGMLLSFPATVGVRGHK